MGVIQTDHKSYAIIYTQLDKFLGLDVDSITKTAGEMS